VAETSSKGRDTFGKILALRVDVEQRILTLGKRVPNARAALNLLSRSPVISASGLEQQLGVSAPTAQALIKDLIRLGVLTEITGLMRGRLYEFQPYLGLFVS
jgi:Fic family protein